MYALRHITHSSNLLAYSSLIVRAGRDYEDTPWLSYDQHYRQHAAAESYEHWGAIWPETWTLHVLRTSKRCYLCGESGRIKCDGAGSANLDSITASSPQHAAFSSETAEQSMSQWLPRGNGKWPCNDQRPQPYIRPPEEIVDKLTSPFITCALNVMESQMSWKPPSKELLPSQRQTSQTPTG